MFDGLKYIVKIRCKPGFGNNKSRFNKLTKRKFSINYKRNKFWSFILNDFVYIISSVKLVRSIRNYGSIDFYVINNNNICKQFVILRQHMINTLMS
ncbi:50S ribosomal protein L28 [Candidatus Hodgkinia cicadicola]|uniref:50S ribosomal protein L28 n=1 Tax=Candidatus Hodgkinia cicadicola TaxID=573658 RepID=A0ABX4MJP3_9HYPH|nr:50S ribosomal protein L28 [Candidatus Hodgkinia cicadicola]PIM95990.1 50S ribosomal protein L28 [Candidatus Hodgkinia cicadicola]